MENINQEQIIEPETPTSRDLNGNPLYQFSDSQQEFCQVSTLNAKKSSKGRLRKPPKYLTDNYYHGELKTKKIEKIVEDVKKEKKKKENKPKSTTTTPKPKKKKNFKNTDLSSTLQDINRTQISSFSFTNRENKISESRETHKIPLLWKFSTESGASGLFVNSKYAFVGSEDGNVYALDLKTAKVIHKLSFGSPVLSIVGDKGFLYVGCKDGVLYDCTTGVPRRAFSLKENQSVEWSDINDGRIVLDVAGTLVMLNTEGEVIWEDKPEGVLSRVNRTVRTDGKNVFHCRNDYLTAYNFNDGKKLWSVHQSGYVTFGDQDFDHIYTAPNRVFKMNKKTGNKDLEYPDIVPWACTVSDKHMYCSDTSSRIYCFEKESGKRLWEEGIGSRGVSMQYFNDVLYVVSTRGEIFAFDVSENAKEVETKIVSSKDSDTVTETKPETEVKKTNDSSWGILVKCIKERGRLRVRVDDSVEGYNRDWNIQFSDELKEEGAKYIVSELVPGVDGGYYRAKGEIEKFIE